MKHMRESTDYMKYTCPTVRCIFEKLSKDLAEGPLRRCSIETREHVRDLLLFVGEVEIKHQVTYQFRDALEQAIDDAWEIIDQKDAEIAMLRKQLAQYTQQGESSERTASER